jgi:SAM-dependent methyltransferase
MPYPVDPPRNKHDLWSPRFSSSERLIEAIGICTITDLWQALEQNSPPIESERLSSVYTYRDAPSLPLSSKLQVIGVVQLETVSVMHQLLGHDDDDDDRNRLPACLHRCIIAVKRADERYASMYPPNDLQHYHNFAKFLRQLRQQGAVAILGPDKYQRFAILQPTADLTMHGDDYEAQDFATNCYVGTVAAVKEYLTNASAIANAATPTAPPSATFSAPTEDGFWKPTGETVSDDSGFWQPPSANETSHSFDYSSSTMEASPWQVGSSSNGGSSIPAAAEPNGSTFHSDAGAAAADRFYSGLTRTLDTRADSRLYHMRAFNGWVKASQIQELDPKPTALSGQSSQRIVGSPLRVLDLACGKGGDLGKWILHPRGIGNYVGIDVARGSLVDAAIRARKMGSKLKRCTFTCADLGADVPGRLKSASHKYMQKLSTWSLQREAANSVTGDPEFKMLRGGGIALDDKFDVVSIQFAIHYMMQTKRRARRFFQTVSELLEIGGNLVATTIDARVVMGHLMNMGLDLHFDNESSLSEPAIIEVGAGACRIRFEPEVVKQIFTTKPSVDGEIDENLFGLEYTFTLVEGSDHASGVGNAVNLPEWLIPIPVLEALGREAGLELEYAQNFHEFFSKRSDPTLHAAAHSSMYNMKVLNRNGSISVDEFEISRLYVALKFRKVRESTMKLNDKEDGDNEEEDEEIDPVLKAKLFPVALMKAKKTAGNDTWATLSGEEKNELTEKELRKLIPKS